MWCWKMSNETVKIDKYVLKTEKSPKIIIFDNDLQKNIVSVNTLNNENNLLLAEMILAELNTGRYEVVEDDGESNNNNNNGVDDKSDDIGNNNNISDDGLTPIDESESNNGAVEPDNIGDTGNSDDTTLTDEDLGNG